MTEELKTKIIRIVKRGKYNDDPAQDITEEIAEVVDEDIVNVLKLSDINGTPMGEVLDGFNLEIRSKE